MPPLPISPTEFLTLFHRTVQCPVPSRLALSLSGGLDSSCLLHLLSASLPSSTSLHALIVDHGARPSSTAEARLAASSLPRNVTHSILPLALPPNLTAFETAARTHRYRALATELVKLDIQHLLLGHHMDDQAETVFLRMLSGARGTGLSGMKPAAKLPEGWGVFGAEELKIYRPLLGVRKERLRTTMIQAGKAWAEDESNQDVRLTARNTARWLLAREEALLPGALRTDRLVRLAEMMRAVEERLEAAADRELSGWALEVDHRWSAAKVKVPLSTESGAAMKVRARALRSILERVCPVPHVSLRGVETLLQRMAEGEKAWTMFGLQGSLDPTTREWSIVRACLRKTEDVRIAVELEGEKWSEWRLWDGRWWMRFKGRRGSLVVTPLEEGDMKLVRKRGQLLKELKAMLPGKSRFTVPAIRNKQDGRVLGLPSVNVWFKGPDAETIEWECRFREPITASMNISKR